MRYSFDTSFQRSLKRFDPLQQLGLVQRILFWRTHDEARFTFVGNHNEVRRFLKHLT